MYFATLPILILVVSAQPFLPTEKEGCDKGVTCCSAGQFAKGKKCELCPPGSYKNSDKLFHTATSCIQCQAGTFQPYAGGRFEGTCRECAAGTFANKPGSTSCKTCPKGTSSNYRATKCSICPAGSSYVPLSTYPNSIDPETFQHCVKCQKRKFSVSSGSTFCFYCPDGFTSTFSRTACRPCRPSEKCFRCEYAPSPRNDVRDVRTGICVSCPLGMEKKYGANKCTPCLKGFFRGSRTLESCKKCKAGTSTASKGGTFCRLVGYGCPKDMIENSVGNCHTCETGTQYSPKKNRCGSCPIGSVSEGGLTARCEKCPGNLEPNPLRRICACPPGTFLDKNGRSCKPCPAGTANSETYHTLRKCSLCKNAGKGASNCPLKCDADEIASLTKSRCEKCPKGLVPNFRQPHGVIDSQYMCVSPRTMCPLGNRRVFGKSRFGGFECLIIPCGLNATKADIGQTCYLCPTGQRLIVGKTLKCRYCENGRISPGGKTTKCTKCKKGLSRNEDSSACACAYGKGVFNGVCKACPAGTFSDGFDLPCKICPAGWTSRKGQASCKKCKAYTFSATPGSPKCTNCPKGTVPNKKSMATSCVAD